MKKINITYHVKLGLLIVALVTFLSTVANAATYYVRTDGNNSNNGLANSAGGAWRTIDFAADNVSAGDVIRVQAGTYEERVSLGVEGTGVDNTVTFVADGEVTMCGFDFPAGSDYIRVIGFTIDTDAGRCSGSQGGITLASGIHTHLEFWNNIIRDASYNGIRQPGWPSATNYASEIIVIGNEMYNFGIGGSGSANAISFPAVNCLFAYNTVHDSYPDAFAFWGHDNRWINNYTYNLLETYGGHADVYQTGSNYLGWKNNLIEAHFQVGQGNQGDEHTCIVQNNQSENCVGSCGDFTQNIWRRNVWHNVSSGGMGLDGPPITYNYYYHNTSAELQENNATAQAGHFMYHGGVTNHWLYNNLEYECWGSTRTTTVQVYYLEGTYDVEYNLAYDPDGSVSFISPWTSQSNAQSNSNPHFNDYANDDFTISDTGGAYGNAGPLTTTSGSGTGTTFNVATDGGGFFRGDNTNLSQYGGNLIVGDTITVGTDTVRISSISGDAITVTDSFTWANGENVYFGDDTTPDIGAYPYKSGGYALTATYVNNSGTVTVTPNDADLVRMIIVFEDNIPIGADSITPFTVSGVGSGTLDVRVYPLFASSQLFVAATESSGSGSPAVPTGPEVIKH
jgi:hypothetical protein